MDKARAILIRRYRYSETSLICVWITDAHGKIKTAARGAFRPKSPFRGKIDLFYEADITFTRARDGDLHALREVSLHQPFDAAGAHYANLAVAAYFGDLADLTTESSSPAAGHYDLLTRAVTYLRTSTPTLRAVTHFEDQLCTLLGIHHSSADSTQALINHCGRLPTSRSTALKALIPLPAQAHQPEPNL